MYMESIVFTSMSKVTRSSQMEKNFCFYFVLHSFKEKKKETIITKKQGYKVPRKCLCQGGTRV